MNTSYFKLRPWQQITAISGLVFCLFYSWFYYASLTNSGRYVESEYQIDSLVLKNRTQTPNYETRKTIALEEALRHAVTIDSLYLWLDASQSILKLQLQGLTVHSVEVQSMEISPILENINPEYHLEMCRKPVKITSLISQTIKESKKIIKAPVVGTHEINTTDTTINEIMNNSALHYSLQLENGMVIKINTSEKSQLKQLIKSIVLKTSAFAQRCIAMAYIRYDNIPAIIKLELSRDDAEIIFRALPNNGFVIIDLSH